MYATSLIAALTEVELEEAIAPLSQRQNAKRGEGSALNVSRVVSEVINYYLLVVVFDVCIVI